jgi:hypothetical protein
VQIIGQAEREGAPPDVLDCIRNAPDRTCQTITDLASGATLGWAEFTSRPAGLRD